MESAYSVTDWLSGLTGAATTQRGEQLELTALTADTLDAVEALERAAHSHPWSRSLLQDAISGRQRGLVALEGGQVVAHLVLCRALDTLEVLNIAVAPSHRRRGYAQCLLSRVIDVMGEQFDTLFLEVRQSNRAAVALYRRLGFDIVGQRRDYYPTPKGREDALLMSLPMG